MQQFTDKAKVALQKAAKAAKICIKAISGVSIYLWGL